MYAFNGLNYTVKEESMADPRMNELYNNMIMIGISTQGQIICSCLRSEWYQIGHFGSWGLLQHVTDSGSQKFDALLSQLLPAGDANLDGTVDYADFQILQAELRHDRHLVGARGFQR